jgi:hypothetical protein
VRTKVRKTLGRREENFTGPVLVSALDRLLTAKARHSGLIGNRDRGE